MHRDRKASVYAIADVVGCCRKSRGLKRRTSHNAAASSALVSAAREPRAPAEVCPRMLVRDGFSMNESEITMSATKVSTSQSGTDFVSMTTESKINKQAM